MLRAEVPPYVSEYVDYICTLLQPFANRTAILVGPIQEQPSRPCVRVGINFEHTLVRSGGRDMTDAPIGLISVPDSPWERYSVRIVNQSFLSQCDVILDYSNPNLFHVRSSRRFQHIASRHLYIAPCLYPIQWTRTGRTIDVLTTFIDTSQPRRQSLLAAANGLCTNVSSCFQREDICRLYQSAKLMLNIHQTPHHHTFEELRVLPALQNGVIVLAEESPLKELIPYHECIIWVSYDTILDVARDVLSRYDDVWTQLFTPTMRKTLESLHESNCETLRQKFQV